MPKVIFRHFANEIIALFPELPGSEDPAECLMIRENGTKTAMSPKQVWPFSKAVSVEDSIFFKEKLIEMGYEDIEVITRESKTAFDKRFQAVAFCNKEAAKCM